MYVPFGFEARASGGQEYIILGKNCKCERVEVGFNVFVCVQVWYLLTCK